MSRATDRALRHVNVSFKSDCPAAAFADALRTGHATPDSKDAVTLFLEEGDEQMLFDLVMEGSSTFETLADLAVKLLPASHPTTAFLMEPPT